MVELSVNPKQKTVEYKIFIDSEPVENLKSQILSVVESSYVAIISEKVYKLYGEKLGFEKNFVYILKDGEREKNFRTYKKITDFMFKKGLTRKSSVIAIGGGVCGDISGFVASTYMRGIDLIQVPTTLLAMADSSVGGKTAIDTDYGKNLIGTFYQPKVVFINTNFLDTLDEKQYKSGLGEVLKYGFIEKSCSCEENFELLQKLILNREKIISRDKEIINEIIENCLKLKISVVNQDEKESGLRRILNFGHTFGHAVEKKLNYKKTHGECVVEGMKQVFLNALKMNLVNEDYYKQAMKIFEDYAYPMISKYKEKELAKNLRTDKKSDGEGIWFILPSGYGEVEIKRIKI